MPRFSPEGRYVAFRDGDRAVGRELFTADLSTGSVAPVRLEFGESSPRYGYYYHPIWSPDGSRLLFATGTATSVDEWWVAPAGGGAARTVNAAAVMARERLLQAVPWAWSREGAIIFSATAAASGRENLFRIEMSAEGLELKGPPVKLTFGTGAETQASMAAGGRLVFASREHNTDLWAVPLLPRLGEATGRQRRLIQGPAAEGWPSATPNGTKVAFVFNRTGKSEFTSPDNEIWIKDLRANTTTPLVVSAGNHQDPLLSHDGKLLLFRVQEDGREATYRIRTAGGIPERVCDHCGYPSDLDASGKTVLVDGFSSPSAIGVFDLNSPPPKVILRAGDADLYAPKFSPDERWIAFHARALQGQMRRIFVAPYRGASEVPRSEWTPVTDGASNDAHPQWPKSGDALYFLSERDGFRCLWAQPLDPATKRPAGQAAPIAHFHEPGLSASTISNPGIVRPNVTRDRIILTLAETTGNLWEMEPRLSR